MDSKRANLTSSDFRAILAWQFKCAHGRITGGNSKVWQFGAQVDCTYRPVAWMGKNEEGPVRHQEVRECLSPDALYSLSINQHKAQH